MPTKLLIADDSTTIQKVFERTFPPGEFALSFASNGEEALAKARSDKPSLIIADINMPLKNGFEVCEEVKSDHTLQSIPVLLLIGILDDFDEDESRRVGADGFIVKPFEANAAISKVRDILGKRERVIPPEKAVKKAIPLREPVKHEEEEIVELQDIVEEPSISEPFPSKEKEEFILQTSLREFEAELKAEFPETKEPKGEEPLSLDLPLDEIETEPIAEKTRGTGLFGDIEIREEEKEIRDEKLESILGQSATELEKIEGLTPKKERKRGWSEEEFEEKFMESFETVFDEKEGGFEDIGITSKGKEGLSKETMEIFAKRLALELGHELRQVMVDVLKDTVPKLVHQEIERSKKE